MNGMLHDCEMENVMISANSFSNVTIKTYQYYSDW